MDRPFAIDRLDHVVLRVQDLQASLAFYEMLGGEQEGDRARVAGVGVRMAPGQTIILQERPDYVPAAVGAVDHIAFAIRAPDIREVEAYLRAHGADVPREARDGPAVSVVNVRDPDGYMIEIRIEH
jgi:catechol 2,3-dioxygenase-like lactoylglutathione lyase family enzyme